jgi:iron complex outermembrane receptor protein
MPTRFDSDIRFTGGLPFVLLSGNADFRSENLVAFEGGARAQATGWLSYEVAVYHNRYHDLRSQDRQPAGTIRFGNSVEGNVSGFEVSSTVQPSTSTRVHGSYAWLHRDIRPEPGSADISGGEGNDAPHLFNLQVFADLQPNVRLNIMTRYVAALPRPRLDGYAEADVTLQWDVRPWAELALVGQDLLHDSHPEFFSGQTLLEEYERSVFVTLTLRRR